MTSTREMPAVDERAVTAPGNRLESRIAGGLLVFTLLFALVVQTLLFHTSSAMGGDVEYHRGVAFTMTAGNFQGEGPIQGVIAYFGGLYPLVIGWGSHLLGVSFDGLLSVLSWPFALALPLTLWWLGRNLWPGTKLEPAVLAFVGTVGSSLALDDKAMWVNSILLSGSQLWPIYPRDVALVLMLVALALVVGNPALRRVVWAGVAIAVAICTQAQVAVFAVAVLCAFLLFRAWGPRAWGQWIKETAVFLAVAFGLSSWWWIPRVNALVESKRLVITSYPGKTTPNMTLGGMLVALGFVGLLALPGAVFALRQSRVGVRFVGVWLVVLAPFALLSGVTGDLGVITSRRTWLLASVPLAICASITATWLMRRGKAPWLLGAVVLALVIPSTAEAWQTRDTVTSIWVDPPASDPYATARWNTTLDRLHDAMQDRGTVEVVTSDNDALYIWRHSGAHPFSFLPAGAAKLGFDVAELTDYGYLQRVRMNEAAQAKGLPGVCALAKKTDADFLVLRRDGDLLGTHDTRPSAKYRIDPGNRTLDTIDRRVGPGLRYLDLSANELLEIAAGKEIALGWHDAAVRRVDVYQDRKRPIPPAWLVLPDGRRITPKVVTSGGGWILRYETPDGVPAGTKLAVNPRGRLRVSRIIGSVPVRDLPGPTSGAVVLDPARVC